MFHTKNLLLIFGILGSIGLIGFFMHSQEVSLEKGRTEQALRVDLVLKKLDQFVDSSELLSRFIQEDINEKILNKKQVEQKLFQYLRASPSELIFGIGIWYEPFRNEMKSRLFGPYVHRAGKDDKNQNDVLTYEWSTVNYNYPAQDWYQKGIQNKGESFFVEPYFDSGLVYLTNSRAFFEENRNFRGVITVDMVLPQLQEIVLQASREGQEVIYVENQNGMLLAHPLKNDFFRSRRIVDGKGDESLLKYKINDLQQELQLDHKKWIETSLLQKKLGWKIVAQSSEELLLSENRKLRNSILVAFAVLWALILMLWKIVEIRADEKKENEERIERGRVQLIQSAKMASLGEMAGGIAHEINNPLSIISSKARHVDRLLKKMNISDEALAKEILVISNMTDRIAKIISGLRSFSRSGESDPLVPVSLDSIVSDTVSLCAEKFANHGVLLEVAEIPAVVINCRATQISQVLLNLMSNSFDAVEGLPVKWIKVGFRVRHSMKQIDIEVVDSGHGIEPHIVKSMMQPFFTTKEVGKGTGLGLSIASGIIEDHKGQLRYDERSSNTKFVMTLPVGEFKSE